LTDNIHPPFVAQKITAGRTTETMSNGQWPPTASKSLVNSHCTHSTPSPIYNNENNNSERESESRNSQELDEKYCS
jgi:hypothetical protein